jgi:hypothetical protein
MASSSRGGYTVLSKLNTQDGLNNPGLDLVQGQDTGITAVCKILPLSQARLREIELHARVSSSDRPNIVALFDVEEDEDVEYLFIEHCEEGSLADLRKRYDQKKRQVPEAFIWKVLIGMLRALCFTHLGISADQQSPDTQPNAIIHRDIRPFNILLASSDDEYPSVKLADFGAAISVDPSAMCLGDPPEWIDLMGLGWTVAALCYGGWSPRYFTHALEMKQKRDKEWLFSAELRDVLRKCLKIGVSNPSEAYTADTLYADAVKTWDSVCETLEMEPLL